MVMFWVIAIARLGYRHLNKNGQDTQFQALSKKVYNNFLKVLNPILKSEIMTLYQGKNELTVCFVVPVSYRITANAPMLKFFC